MKSLRYVKIVVLCVITLLLFVSDIVRASGPVFISGVQVKGVGSNVSSQEAVKLTNDTDMDINIANWCVAYASYSATTIPSGGSCIVAEREGDKVILGSQQSMWMVTNELTQLIRLELPDFMPDGVLASGLSNSSGSIYLLSDSREVLDNVRWYTSSSSVVGEVNLKPVTGAPENISFQKGIREESYISSPLPLTIGYGNLYEIADVCTNLEGFQEFVPDGYVIGEEGCVALDACDNIDGIQGAVPEGYVRSGASCVKDVCDNIDDIQITIPDGMMSEGTSCYEDICTNLDGLQASLPVGYYLDDMSCMPLENRFLRINELLPNVTGTDTGFEYVEVFNPFDTPVSLAGYSLEVGKTFEKRFTLPADVILFPDEYYVVRSSDISFTLLNTTSSVRLITPAGDVADSVTYSDPADDMSWSYFDGVWEYTNQLTPGRVNLRMMPDEEEADPVVGLAPCEPGKYRYPLTNRCRSITADLSTISSCDADEYRNPETNRCRKITSALASLAPCTENQERNPETNRCRSVQATAVLTPCAEGQERNPDTNRCRKILGVANDLAQVVSTASSEQVEGPPTLSPSMIGTGAVLLAAGYGVFEWRVEVIRVIRRLLPFTK